MDMMDDDTEEITLEQGRRQLQLLSKQLHNNNNTSDHSVGSSNRLTLQAERRLLDQKPRGDRLRNRKGSPLGLTLEEMDDRGLLDGGGVVPSYYTSLKQKERRSLELQRRSSRMKHRGVEGDFKRYSKDSLVRMIRVLIRRGTNFEELFQNADPDGRGIIEKSQFVSLVRAFSLPYTVRELSSFALRYSVSEEHVDYEAFLQDIVCNNNEQSLTDNETFENFQDGNMHTYSLGHVLQDLYRMLADSKIRLEKNVDEIYRMFSRWDYNGKRNVTSTQFFRVLSQLHVNFNDQEQDFIVELLDTNSEGKINFDALLRYCFQSSTDDDPIQVSDGGSHQPTYEGGDESLVSLDGGSVAGGTISADVRSITSGNASRRPHTAAFFRRNLSGTEYDAIDDSDSHTNLNGVPSPVGPDTASLLRKTPQKQALKRPLTASARVVHSESNGNTKSMDLRIGQDVFPQDGSWLRGDEENNFILDVSSGSDIDDDLPVGNKWIQNSLKKVECPNHDIIGESRSSGKLSMHNVPYDRVNVNKTNNF